MLAALARVAVSTLRQPSGRLPSQPGPVLTAEIPPRPDQLVDAYVRWSGADPTAYRDSLPPHFFPQWGFPLLSRTLGGLPLRLAAVLNQGARVEVRAPVPRRTPLRLQARLESVSEEETKIRIHQKLITGTLTEPELHVAHVFAVIPKTRPKKTAARTEETPAFNLAGSWQADRKDGLRFGILTGDLNPIHWLPPYAKMAGFSREILHGFATFARTWETLVRFGAGQPLRTIDIRFLRPVVLPAKVRVEVAPSIGPERALRVTGDAGLIYAAGTYDQ